MKRVREGGPFVAGLVVGALLMLTLPALGSHNNGGPSRAYTHNHDIWFGNAPYLFGPPPGTPCYDPNLDARTLDALENPQNIPGGHTWDAYTDAAFGYASQGIGGCSVGGGDDRTVYLICDPPPGMTCAPYGGGGGWQAATVYFQVGCHLNCGNPSTAHHYIDYAYIVFDPTEPWWSAQSDPPSYGPWGGSYFDLWSALSHEIGHIIGLSHWFESDNTMCPNSNQPVLRSSMCPVPQSNDDQIDDAQRNPDNSDHIASVNEAY